MSRNPVVITGLGVVAPHGDTPEAVFEALLRGESAAHLWQNEDVPPTVVCAAPFAVERWFTKLQLPGVDRVSQIAVAAAESARAHAGIANISEPARVGVFVGTGMGGAQSLDQGYENYRQNKRVPPLTVPAFMSNAAAAHIAIRAKITGPVYTYSVACASSAVAIAEAAKAIALGEIDFAIAGGTEALIVPGVVRAWQALQTLAGAEGDPAQACRPFDAKRSGFVLGEGAAMLVLESRAHAQARGAKIIAEIAGWGVSCDASHLTKPSAAGQVQALRQMLRATGLQPSDIGYCNAHGTATRVGDVAESQALAEVWGNDLPSLKVSSTKALHGHLLGAAGALEAVITALAVQRGQLPPAVNCTEPEPECAIALVGASDVEAPNLKAAISNSFAFGGTNVVLAFRRAQ